MSAEFNYIGTAAEHFVAYDLWRRQIECCMTAANMEYDLIAFLEEPVRIQVKATSGLKERMSGEKKYRNVYDRYRFDCTRGRKGYDNVDIFALVALDKLAIMYVPYSGRGYYTFKDEDFSSPMLSDVSWFYCMERLYGGEEQEDE